MVLETLLVQKKILSYTKFNLSWSQIQAYTKAGFFFPPPTTHWYLLRDSVLHRTQRWCSITIWWVKELCMTKTTCHCKKYQEGTSEWGTEWSGKGWEKISRERMAEGTISPSRQEMTIPSREQRSWRPKKQTMKVASERVRGQSSTKTWRPDHLGSRAQQGRLKNSNPSSDVAHCGISWEHLEYYVKNETGWSDVGSSNTS